jgi:AraC-like DNA-binding protein
MPRAPLVEISSTSLAKSERFAYWADVVTQRFVPLECDSPDRANFHGSIRHRQIGLIGISDVQASAMRAHRTRATISHAPSDDLIVVLHVDGTCHAGQKATALNLGCGDGAIVSTSDSYFFEFPKQFRQIVLKLPKHLLAEERIARDCQRSISLASGPARLLGKLALSSLDDPAEFSNDEEVGIERAFIELLRPAATIMHGATPDHYSEARHFIRRHLADPNLKPAAIASELGMSTRNLARLFANQGTTIERAIWSERLAAARRDLLDPGLAEHSVTAIAFSWAFNDAAHFSRSFSKAYGRPPSVYRTEHSGLFARTRRAWP